MKKKVLPLVLTAAMALCAVPAMADDAVEVISTTQAVTVNGEKVDFEGFNIEGFNYFKLEDVAAAVDKNVTFDGKTFTIEEAPAEETTAPTEATEETPAEETAKATEETPAEETAKATEATPTEETAKATEAIPAEETAKTTEATAEETAKTTEATAEETAKTTEAPAEETAKATEEAPAEEEAAVEEGTEETTDVEYSSIEVEGVEYFKLRDLADIIGFGVDYDAATSTVVITTEAE